MTKEQLETAKKIEVKIANLKGHKERIEARKGTARLTISLSADRFDPLAMDESNLIIPPIELVNLYLSRIDSKIKQFESEFDAI